MTVAVQRYKAWLAGEPCIRCGARPVQLHHEDGCRSRKTGLWMRKRQNEADVFLLPVCEACHRERHEIGRRAFEESIGRGEGFLTEMVATFHCRYLTEGSRT